MKKYMVITTINPKSEGIAQFEKMKDWQLVIVGDQKSSFIKSSGNLLFLSVEDQLNLGYEYAALCPFNHYSRKNIGYLYAIQHGADVIYDTDDDNIPYRDWGVLEFTCSRRYSSSRMFINVYKYFSKEFCWPRGFPLDEINQAASLQEEETKPVNIGVWQSLADVDPDVDAIFRLVFNYTIKFEDKPAIYIGKGTYCPFNSQNSTWQKKAFPYLYLPGTTSFRFTDILRGYIAQRFMWEEDLHLGFTKATVFQKRNAHNLMNDFAEEMEAYLNVKPISEFLNSLKVSSDPFVGLETIYRELAERGYVKSEELSMCQAWIADLRHIMEKTSGE